LVGVFQVELHVCMLECFISAKYTRLLYIAGMAAQ
jgi:hypothetical protein